MEYKVTNRIHSKEINQLIRIKHISFRLAHLSVSLKQPRMSKYLLWKWKIQCHQEDRPVNGMETDDIFSDQVKVCRPEFVKLLSTISLCIISDSCNIVCQSIQPYIHNMLWIKINRDSPLK